MDFVDGDRGGGGTSHDPVGGIGEAVFHGSGEIADADIGAVVVADAAEGDVGVEFLLGEVPFPVGKGGAESGLQCCKAVDRTVQAEPEHAGVAHRGEAAEIRGAEIEGGVIGDDGRETEAEELDAFAGLLAEEVQGEVEAGGIHPAHRPAEGAEVIDDSGSGGLRLLWQGDGEKDTPEGVDGIGARGALFGWSGFAWAHGGSIGRSGGIHPASPAEATVKTAFLGPLGTFSEVAALEHAGERGALVPFPSFPAAAAALERGEVDEAVLPVENSIEGAISAVLDLIIHGPGFKIRDELVVPVRHFLIAPPGATIEGITTLVSHPQPLGQCRKFIEAHLPNAEQVAALSTAAAVEEVLRAGDVHQAAIGTRRAAELYGGVILAEDIQDDPSNMTRFVVLAHEDAPPTGDDKTSIGFTTHANVPGSIHAVLTIFAEEGMQLVKIESRPVKYRLYEYVFLVDFEGHRTDPAIARALERAKGKTLTLDVYGSYPRFPLERIMPSPPR